VALADAIRAAAPTYPAHTTARILTFDIETKPHLAWIWDAKTRYVTADKIAERGGMISFAAKWYGSKAVEFRSVHGDGMDVMLERIRALLDEADIVVSYNGDRFDIPRVTGELVRAGMSEPSPFRSVDLIKTVRRMGWPYAKLDEVSKELGLPGKTAHQGFGLWLDCMKGDPAAWALMEKYNCQDVRLTEAVYDALRPFIKGHPNLALWSGVDDEGSPIEACCNCGGANLKAVTAPGGERATVKTALTSYALLRCAACGTHLRRNFIKARVTLRPVR
jgi:hypothetical protein